MKGKRALFLVVVTLFLLVALLAACDRTPVVPEVPIGGGDEPAPEETIFSITVDNGAEIIVLEKKEGEIISATAAELSYKLFLHWEYEGEIASKERTYELTVKQDASLRAVYCDAYTLYLDPGDGLVESESVTVGLGYSYQLPVPYLEHHIFMGWYDGARQYTDENGVSLENFQGDVDVVLKAKYLEKPVYSVSVSNGEQEPEIFLYHEDEIITLEAVALADKKCIGWSDGNEMLTDENTYTFTVKNHASFTAVYKDAYIVTVVNASGSGEYQRGETATISLSTIATGKEFVGWTYYLSENEEIISTDTTYSFVVTQSVMLIAVFKDIEYTLTYLVDNEQYGETETLKYNQVITLRDKPSKEHYNFNGWLNAPQKMPASDLVIYGNFVLQRHRLTVIGGTGGGVYDYGSQVTVRPTVDIGKAFDNWTVNNTEVSTDFEYVFTLERDLTVCANFLDIEYTLTYYVYGAEYGVDGGVYEEFKFIYNERTTRLAPLTKEHYTFVGWSMIPDNMPAANVTITGSFIVDRHSLSVTNGFINIKDEPTSGVFDWNEEVTVSPTIPIGKRFVGWEQTSQSGVIISAEENYTFKMPGDYSLNAVLEDIYYTITYYLDGVIYDKENPASFVYGSTVIVKPNPVKENYDFNNWKYNGSDIPSNMTMPAEDIVFEGYFTLMKRTVRIHEKTGYLFNDRTLVEGTYDHGTLIKATATPPTGFAFKEWRDNGSNTVIAGAGAVYEFEITSDITLEARFSTIWYTASYYTKMPGEEYSSCETRNFSYNTAFSPIANPNVAHYDFSGWHLEGGGDLPARGPAHDLEIYGEYTIHTHKVTVRNGTIKEYPGESTVTVDYNTKLTLAATVPEGKDFVAWHNFDGAPVSYTAEYSFHVAGDSEFEARFKTSVFKVTVTDGRIAMVDGESVTGIVTENNYDWNSEITVIANADPTGKYFSHWEVNGVKTTENTSYMFTLKEMVNVVAVFNDLNYTVTYFVKGPDSDINVPYVFADAGTYPNPISNCHYGDKIIRYDAPPIDHYSFSGWKIGSLFGEVMNPTHTMPDRDLKIYGEYILDTHTLTVDGGTGGGVYEYNSSVTVTATPPTGKRFVQWTDGSGSEIVGAQAEYTFNLIEDTAVTAVFTDIDYTVSYVLYGADYPAEGEILFTCSTAHYGDTLADFTAQAEGILPEKVNFVFGAWTYNGGALPETMPAEDMVINGTYIHIFSYEENGEGLTVSANNDVKDKYPNTISIPSYYENKTVTSVAERGFESISNLQHVTVPATVSTIGYAAFGGNEIVTLELPILSGGYLGYIFGASSSSVTDVIPATLKKVTVTCEVIPERAFYKLNGIEEIEFPNAVSIGIEAFEACGLTVLTIPETVTNIGANAFRELNNLSEIYYNAINIVTELTEGLFYGSGVAGGAAVTIGENVESVPSKLFSSGESTNMYAKISSVTFAGNQVTAIGNRAFYRLAQLGCELILPVSVTSIGEEAFGYTGLTKVTVPYSVTEIGKNAFSYMTQLTEIIYNATNATTVNAVFVGSGKPSSVKIGANVRVIPAKLFQNASVTTVEFLSVGDELNNGGIYTESSVINIQDYAFYATVISTVNLPSSLETIGSNAFGYCAQLTTINIPERVSNIGSNAFRGCIGLTTVNFDASDMYDVSDGAAIFDNSSIVLNVGASVNRVPSYLFKDNTGIKSVIFAEGSVCTEIGDYAFAGASALTAVTLKGNLERIGEYAFTGIGAGELVLPYSVYFIGAAAFKNSVNLMIKCETTKERTQTWKAGWSEGVLLVTYSENNRIYNDFEYVVSGDKVYITSFIGSGAVDVPAEIDGKTVAGVGDAFAANNKITSISLPSGVTKIFDYAFANLSSLVSFTALGEITYLGESAFSGCVSMSTFVIVFSGDIGNNAFYNCQALNSFDFTNVTYIGEGAFAYSGLDTVVLPIVTGIGAEAFLNSAISEITFSENLETIGVDAFKDCRNLLSFNVENNVNFTAVDGVLFSGSRLRYYPAAKETVHYTVPDTITEVGNNAFRYAKINELTIPVGITNIGSGAFAFSDIAIIYLNGAEIANLTELDKPFEQDENKTVTINVGADVTRIPDYLFFGAHVTEINFAENGALTYIGAYSFYGFKGNSLSVPATVTEIGHNAFYNETVTTLNFNANVSDANYGNDVFGKMGSNAVINVNSASVPSGFIYNAEVPNNTSVLNLSENTTSIGRNAFRNSSLKTVTLGANITEISDYAFADCSSLSEINILFTANVTGNNIFDNSGVNAAVNVTAANVSNNLFKAVTAPSVSSITLNDVERVGTDAFFGLTQVTELILPGSLTTIESGAFKNLSAITEITIPSAVTGIGADAFWGTSSLQNIYLNAEELADNILGEGESIQIFDLDDGADLNITIGAGVKRISAYLFAANTNGTRVKNIVNQSVALADIGAGAFKNLTSAAFVFGAAIISKIREYAFYNCKGIEGISLQTVDSIGACAFAESGVTSIAISSFSANDSQTIVIGDEAFLNCANLTTVNINGANRIGMSVFKNCVKLNSVQGFESLTAMSTNVFENCSSLTTIDLSNINTIPSFSFYNCTLLESITLVASLENVGESAFEGCKALSSFLSTQLRTISNKAFADSGLTSITLPSSLTAIGTEAFSGCTKLTAINYNAANIESVYTNESKVFHLAGTSEGNLGITLTVGADVRIIPDYLFYGLIDYVEGSAENAEDAVAYTVNIVNLLFAERIATPIADNGIRIGNYSFMNLPLSTVELSDYVTDVGKYGFANCNKATVLTWGEGLINVDYRSFAGMVLVTEFNHNAKDLADSNFMRKDININNGVFEQLGIGADGITMNIGIYVRKIHDEMFAVYTNSDLSLYVPKILTVNMNGSDRTSETSLTYIGSRAFYRNVYLSAFTDVPETISVIGAEAFRECIELSAADKLMINASSIGAHAFMGCSKLSKIVLGENLNSLGTEAFLNCISVTELVLSTAGDENSNHSSKTFSNLGSSVVGTTVTIGATVNYIPSNIFNGENVNIIHVNFEYREINFRSGTNGLTIGEYAFNSITGMQSISFDKRTVDGIELQRVIYGVGDYAFYSAGSGFNEPNFQEFLFESKYTLENEVNRKFQNCVIGQYAFSKSAITEIKQIYNEYKNGDIYYYNKTIFEIKDYAFAECTKLTTLSSIIKNTAYIGDNFDKIGNSAFEGCTEFNFTENGTFAMGVRSIGARAFYGCTSLTRIANPNAVYTVEKEEITGTANIDIGASAFEGTNLTEIYVLKHREEKGSYEWSVGNTWELLKATEVADYAFNDVRQIKFIISESNVFQSIGTCAFQNTVITAAYISDTIQKIGAHAFRNSTIDEMHVVFTKTESPSGTVVYQYQKDGATVTVDVGEGWVEDESKVTFGWTSVNIVQ